MSLILKQTCGMKEEGVERGIYETRVSCIDSY